MTADLSIEQARMFRVRRYFDVRYFYVLVRLIANDDLPHATATIDES